MIRGVILLFATVAVSALLGAGTASAVSPYDNLFQNTSSLNLSSSNVPDCSADLSLNWSSIFQVVPSFNSNTTGYFDGSNDPNSSQSIPFNFSSSSDNGAMIRSTWDLAENWAVSMLNSDEIRITWTDDPNATIIFQTRSSLPQLSYSISPGYTVWSVSMANYKWSSNWAWTANGRDGCGVSVGPLSTYYPSTSSQYQNILFSTTGVSAYLYFAMGDVIYPPDYDGSIINDSAPEPPVITDFKPDFYVSAARDWKSMIHDKNFNTFDANPFLCSEDLAPVLHFTIWDISDNPEVILETASVSATAQIEYQFPRIATKTKYRIDGYYDCGSPPEIQFNEVGSKEFEIDRNGNLVIAGFSSCVQPEAPFVFIDQCLIGVNDMLAILAFKDTTPSIENANLISVANQNPNNCYTMGTLGDWIGREDQYLCPAFPANVRNTVTPFIMFVLAGTVLYFISRSKGNII